MKIFSFLSRKLHDATRSNSAENWQRPKSKQSRRVIKINNSKQAKMFSQDAPPGPCVDAIWRVQRRSIKSSEKKSPVTSSSPPEELWNTDGGCTNKHGRNESCWPSGHPQCFHLHALAYHTAPVGSTFQLVAINEMNFNEQQHQVPPAGLGGS